MTTIGYDTIKNLYYANIIFELHQVKDKILLFEKKYGKDFNLFEKEIKESSEENFDNWDDYMEWKAYQNSLVNLSNQKKDLEDGNIKVT